MTTPPARQPGAPSLEIERKFLLRGRPDLPPSAVAYEIEQGYLPEEPRTGGGDDEEIVGGRLRRIIGPGGHVRHVHTVKRGTGLVRTETERPVGPEVFAAHWPRTEGRRLRKTRFVVPAETGGVSVQWEIDVFEDRDLVLAEVELPSVDIEVEFPAWLASSVVREVTGDPAYRNFALATERRPDRR